MSTFQCVWLRVWLRVWSCVWSRAIVWKDCTISHIAHFLCFFFSRSLSLCLFSSLCPFLRKISTTEMFCPSKNSSFSEFRQFFKQFDLLSLREFFIFFISVYLRFSVVGLRINLLFLSLCGSCAVFFFSIYILQPLKCVWKWWRNTRYR